MHAAVHLMDLCFLAAAAVEQSSYKLGIKVQLLSASFPTKHSMTPICRLRSQAGSSLLASRAEVQRRRAPERGTQMESVCCCEQTVPIYW